MSEHGDIDLLSILHLLVSVALTAGRKISSARPRAAAAGTKKNSSDLVTETDRAVEDLVSAALRAAHPTFAFMGEETYRPGMRLGDGPTFVCDPIDGTTNFVHGHAYVSISLAFVLARRTAVAVVYNMFRGELFHAVRGRGAFVAHLPFPTGDDDALAKALDAVDPKTFTLEAKPGTQRLPLLGKAAEPLAGLDQALVAVEWGSERAGNNWDVKVKTFAALAGDKEEQGGAMVHSLRSLGSAALNLCGVAAGHLDAYWEGGCWAWDVAAGWLVLEEAGGTVVGGNAGEWDAPLDCRRYLAVRAAGGGGPEQRAFIQAFWARVAGTLEYEV